MTKGPNAQKFWNQFSSSEKKKIKTRAAKRIKEYRNLQELRKAAGLTQAVMSAELKMPQSNISRLEKNSDMLLSTLRDYVEALGGKLSLTVELPDMPPVALTGFGDLIDPEPPAGRRR
ncbi:MAG: XRE family transcriptional regulator [Alphaproteobacteria bacterium]|nr:XRE family transcriptional regulator [Alphaproteobacteria bacterium]MBP7759334.1 XRE family transcriptional regulator [Alphaproteobacteria bacterium]MBP7762547.1 XRE family transcriptional regulator [Alphaproteobacteria bacterium]MBP7904294.1 XRE family transcriptional regulator [Alphaproteobacteria bacterium]